MVGAIDRPHFPRQLLDSVAQRLENEGAFSVSDDAREPAPSSYRVPDGRTRSVCIQAANPATALSSGFEELRLWQKDSHTLCYDVAFRRWLGVLRTRVIAAAAAGAVGLLLPVVTRMVPLRALAVFGTLLVAFFVGVLVTQVASHRRRLRALVESVVDDEIAHPFAARIAQTGPEDEAAENGETGEDLAARRAQDR